MFRMIYTAPKTIQNTFWDLDQCRSSVFILTSGQRSGFFSGIEDLDTFLHKFGLHTGETLDDWLGKKIAIKLGDPDATFEEVGKHKLSIPKKLTWK